jgi:proteasome beta subunit
MDTELKKNIMKTGTSTVGIVCKGGIVMAGDRQATLGSSIVGSKKTPKIYQINEYLVVSVSGNASDSQMALRYGASQLKLKELKDKKRPNIKEAASFMASMCFQLIRKPSMIPSVVGSLVGGFNENGTTELYTIIPDGTIEKVEDYDANISSGMPYMLGLLERQYKKNITVEEGIKLAIECIKSSTQRDVGSGFGIDVMTITKEGIKHAVKQKIEPLYTERN